MALCTVNTACSEALRTGALKSRAKKYRTKVHFVLQFNYIYWEKIVPSN